MTGKTIEAGRVTTGPTASDRSFGFNGAFFLPGPDGMLRVISSDGMGWEHVSVSRDDRCPTWDEMNFIKDLFWDDHECVVQFHPPKSEYVNNHRYRLHLWKPTTAVIPLPPSLLVGLKSAGTLTLANGAKLAAIQADAVCVLRDEADMAGDLSRDDPFSPR